MMENVGYRDAINLALAELAKREPAEITKNTGVLWNGDTFEVPWFNRIVAIGDGSIGEQIIWYHYMLARGPKEPRGVHIAYHQVPGAAIYNSVFLKRCVRPIVDAFHEDLDAFLDNGKLLGGRQEKLGHASFTVDALPHVPLTFVLWQGDDEIPANGNILYDQTAVDWLCAEDLVVLAELSVYKLLQAGNAGREPDAISGASECV